MARNVLLGTISLVGILSHEAHPEWGYAPLMIWLVLIAIIHGVSFWLWAREAS